jgi:hypothetical protein
MRVVPALLLVFVLGLGLVASACSSSGPADTGTFASTPASVVTSDSGTLRIAFQSSPEATPSRGNNSLRLMVTRVSDGAPVGGLVVDVVPWMLAMGHGSSTKPTVTAGPEVGAYTVSNVDLFMPGLWEIRTTLGGPVTDHAAPQFDVP